MRLPIPLGVRYAFEGFASGGHFVIELTEQRLVHWHKFSPLICSTDIFAHSETKYFTEPVTEPVNDGRREPASRTRAGYSQCRSRHAYRAHVCSPCQAMPIRN